jgi:CheY-like chemotaxis protein/two-component sensor histidine kinase
MIDELLDMSRIVSGKLRLDIQPVDLSGVIESVLETIRPGAEAKAIRIQSVIEAVDAVVHGDPHRLQQVVWNLLSNAIKFTPKGGRVQVVLKRVDSHVELVISDTGQGIDADFLPHVFERFRQADASTSREFGGLGLGLSIVRQLTELHGGSVRAASDGKGRGSTFTVELPLAAVHKRPEGEASVHPRATGAQADGEPVRLAGIRVLVLDDDPDARDLIKHVLEESGASVVVAASAQEARTLLEAQPPHVIVSDIGMPGEDGYRFIAGVRRAGVMTPAIALTAFARSEDRTRALLAGYQAHIAKPVEPLELIASVLSLAQAARGAMTS